jgi:hypothetical protein
MEDEKNPDLVIGDVAIGKYMKSNLKWNTIGIIAAIVAACASIATLIVTLLK